MMNRRDHRLRSKPMALCSSRYRVSVKPRSTASFASIVIIEGCRLARCVQQITDTLQIVQGIDIGEDARIIER